jgi:hypothetical protein
MLSYTDSASKNAAYVSALGRSDRMAYRTSPDRARDGPAHGPEPGCASTEKNESADGPSYGDQFSLFSDIRPSPGRRAGGVEDAGYENLILEFTLKYRGDACWRQW